MELIISIGTTILSVIIGGLLTMIIAKKELHDNTKVSIYLEFLNNIEGRYDYETTNDYLKVLRKVMLVANDEVFDTLLNITIYLVEEMIGSKIRKALIIL